MLVLPGMPEAFFAEGPARLRLDAGQKNRWLPLAVL